MSDDIDMDSFQWFVEDMAVKYVKPGDENMTPEGIKLKHVRGQLNAAQTQNYMLQRDVEKQMALTCKQANEIKKLKALLSPRLVEQ